MAETCGTCLQGMHMRCRSYGTCGCRLCPAWRPKGKKKAKVARVSTPKPPIPEPEPERVLAEHEIRVAQIMMDNGASRAEVASCLRCPDEMIAIS